MSGMRWRWLYNLALKYIGYCNREWGKYRYHYMDIKNLIYLTYKSGTKYYLKYGADAEWSCFSNYDILDNAIQRLGKYEEIKLKREREDIGMDSMNKPYLINIIRKDADGTVRSILSSELRFSSISDAVSYINAYRNSYPVMIVAWVEKEDIFGIKKVVWIKSFVDSYGKPVFLDEAV